MDIQVGREGRRTKWRTVCEFCWEGLGIPGTVLNRATRWETPG